MGQKLKAHECVSVSTDKKFFKSSRTIDDRKPSYHRGAWRHSNCPVMFVEEEVAGKKRKRCDYCSRIFNKKKRYTHLRPQKNELNDILVEPSDIKARVSAAFASGDADKLLEASRAIELFKIPQSDLMNPSDTCSNEFLGFGFEDDDGDLWTISFCKGIGADLVPEAIDTEQLFSMKGDETKCIMSCHNDRLRSILCTRYTIRKGGHFY